MFYFTSNSKPILIFYIVYIKYNEGVLRNAYVFYEFGNLFKHIQNSLLKIIKTLKAERKSLCNTKFITQPKKKQSNLIAGRFRMIH